MKSGSREIRRNPGKEAAILEAALHEFATRGFRAADVQVVADRAGVGKGTIYRYFENKDGLFRAVAHDSMRQLEERFLALVGEDLPFLEVARQMVRAYASHFQTQPEYVEILIQERAEFRGTVPDIQVHYRDRNVARIEALFQAAIDDGTLRPVDVVKTVVAVGDALYGTVVRGVIEGRASHLADDAEYTFDLLLHGLRA